MSKTRVGLSAVALLILLIAIMTWWSKDSSSEFPVYDIQESNGIIQFKTQAGLEVYFLAAPDLPMVDIQLMLDAGSVHDQDKQGLASLVGTMLNQGTTAHSADELAENFAEVGAIVQSDVTRDYASLSLRSLIDENKLRPALSLYTEMLSQSNFPEQAYQLRQAQQLASIKYQQQKPGNIASRTFYRLLYPNHPYGQSREGSLESVRSIQVEDMEKFYQGHYTNDNAVLAIVGAITTKSAHRIADKVGRALIKANSHREELPEPEKVESIEQIIEFPSQQTHIFMGTLGVKRGDEDYFSLYVGNHILGGDSISELFREVREERGLAYSVYSQFMPMKETGPFVIGLQTKNAERDKALQTVETTLEQFIDNGPTEAELVAAKQYITGSMPLRISSNKATVRYLAMIGYYNLPIDYLETFNDHIEAVTVDDVKAAFKKHVDLENKVTVVVGQTL